VKNISVKSRHNEPLINQESIITKNNEDVNMKKRNINTLNRERVFEQLKIDEGVVYEIYLDHLGYPTFGVGHLVTKRDPEFGLAVGTPVSKQRVWEAFEQDLDLSIGDCNTLYGPMFGSWPSEVQEVMVNMMFNLGRPRLSQFVNMRSSLMGGNWKMAAQHGRNSLWYRQVTNRAERLMSRLESV
jgi:lysozyme